LKNIAKEVKLDKNAFKTYISDILKNIKNDYIDLKSGDIHRELGGYPGKNHQMSICCNVMRELMLTNDLIVYEPPKGNGASFTIRYNKRR